MPLKRRGSGVYCYRNVRQGKRVISQYLGHGETARMIGMIEEADREEARERAAEDRKRRAEEGARLEAEDARADELCGLILDVVRDALEMAGYHRHNRGGWRKRRMVAAIETPGTVEVPATAEGRLDIFERARKGDRSALPTLRAMFREKPELLEAMGNPARWAERSTIASLAGKNAGIEEGLERKMKELRRELAGPNPTMVERLLAERAALCWLRLHQAEHQDAVAEGRSIVQADFERKRIDSMHRRYVSSLTALAQVRKLDLTAIQVNLDMRSTG